MYYNPSPQGKTRGASLTDVKQEDVLNKLSVC